jgi:hypothetical protein
MCRHPMFGHHPHVRPPHVRPTASAGRPHLRAASHVRAAPNVRTDPCCGPTPCEGRPPCAGRPARAAPRCAGRSPTLQNGLDSVILRRLGGGLRPSATARGACDVDVLRLAARAASTPDVQARRPATPRQHGAQCPGTTPSNAQAATPSNAQAPRAGKRPGTTGRQTPRHHGPATPKHHAQYAQAPRPATSRHDAQRRLGMRSRTAPPRRSPGSVRRAGSAAPRSACRGDRRRPAGSSRLGRAAPGRCRSA